MGRTKDLNAVSHQRDKDRIRPSRCRRGTEDAQLSSNSDLDSGPQRASRFRGVIGLADDLTPRNPGSDDESTVAQSSLIVRQHERNDRTLRRAGEEDLPINDADHFSSCSHTLSILLKLV